MYIIYVELCSICSFVIGILLRIISSRFIHVEHVSDYLSLLKLNNIPIVCMCDILFIQSSLSQYLYCVHLFATVNNAALNTSIQMSVRSLFSVCSGVYPEVELLDHMATLCLLFKEPLLVFHSSCTIYILPSKGSDFSTSSPALVIFCFFSFDDRLPNGCEVVSCDFYLHFSRL